MAHPFKKTFVPLFILVTSMLLDGVISNLFQAKLHTGFGYMIPRLILLAFLLLSFYLPVKQLIILALVFGLWYDSFYTGILGVYTAAFTIMVYGVAKTRKIFFPNIAMIGLVGIVALTAVELFVFSTFRMISLIEMDLAYFAARRLGPTLLLNSILFLAGYYPVNRWLITTFENDR